MRESFSQINLESESDLNDTQRKTKKEYSNEDIKEDKIAQKKGEF